jgi:antitoxin component of MazEF toxin-antitoxin module
MSKYIVTVIKTGNSYALRVPKAYVVDGRLNLGEKTAIALPTPNRPQDRVKIQSLLEELQTIERPGGLKNIKDPIAWQREMRQDRPLPGRD